MYRKKKSTDVEDEKKSPEPEEFLQENPVFQEDSVPDTQAGGAASSEAESPSKEGDRGTEAVQLTFDTLKNTDAAREVVLDGEMIEVKTFLDVEAARAEEIKLPLTYGREIKLPKKNIFSVTGVDLMSLEQKLYNFKLAMEEGTGRRVILLKNRECRLTFEGTVNPNGSIGMPKLLSYSICKDLTFKRAIEVYTFMQKLLAGSEVEVRGKGVEFTVELPNRFEYLKLLKVVEIMYKYYHISKDDESSSRENIGFILRNARKISEASLAVNERTVETMAMLEGEGLEALKEASSVRVIKRDKIKLKNKEILYEKIIIIPENVPKTNEQGSGVSASWKKAKIEYKKVLD